MAVTHGKRTKVWMNSTDMSPYLRDATVTRNTDMAESSTYGGADKTYVAGLTDGRMTFGGIYDNGSSAEDVVIPPLLGQDIDVVVTVCYGYPSVASGLGTRGKGTIGKFASYEVTSPIGDVTAISAELNQDDPKGGVESGVLLNDPGTPVLFSGLTGTGQDDSGGGTTRGAWANLHILANTLNTGTATIKVQHSATVGGAYVDLMTFTPVASGTTWYERQSVLGNVNQYLKATVSTGAASGQMTMVLIAGKRFR